MSTLRAVIGISLLLMVAGTSAKEAVSEAGPFRIETVEKSISAGGFPNTSGNPFRRTKVTAFRVTHRGKRVVVSDGKASFDEFWEAKVLEGPRPAVLLAVTGMYLVSDDQGQARVDILAPGDTSMATWQWLDGEGGQPAPEQLVGIRHAGEEPRLERGGRLLLVNRKVLLDLSTLAARPMIAYTSENVRLAGDYNASGEPARMLSPGRTQYALVGNRYVNEKFEYAFVVMDIATGRAYAVPFDRNALRFESVHDATPEWIGRYFEWKRGTGGTEALQARRDAKPAPWMGRFTKFGGGNVEYRLEPTTPEMVAVVYEFVVGAFGAQRDASPKRLAEGNDSRAILVDGKPLRIFHDAPRRTTSLYAENIGAAPGAYDLVEKIGKRFNEDLAQGKHQRHFTEYPQ